MLLENTKAELWELVKKYYKDKNGFRREQDSKRILIKTPLLVVTDMRMVFIGKDFQPMYESIYDLPYLHTYLPILKSWNDNAEMKIEQAQSGEGALKRWFTSGEYRRKFGLRDSVNLIGTVDHPSGLLGPKHYLVMTEATFRPVSAERQQNLRAEQSGSGSFLTRVKLGAEAANVGKVFTYRPVYLYVKERETLDTIAATLNTKLAAMNSYLSDPSGLQREYDVPASDTQGFAGYRPPDMSEDAEAT
jgi:hypothetical protein